MRLKDGIFYREYNEFTFVYDTEQDLAHAIPTPIAVFFDLFKEGMTETEAVENLKNRYPDVSVNDIEKDVHDFVEFLISKKMVEESISFNMPENEQNVLAEGWFFQKYTIENELLYSAMIEITHKCPEKCKHCYQSSLRTEDDFHEEILTFEEIKNLLDELFEMNVLELVITGGEPFARRDCFEILEYAKEKGFATTIFSNGILLTEDDLVKLSRLKIKCFSTSLYSHIQQRHDAITGVVGSYEKTLHVLKTLSKYGINTDIKFVLMEENKNDFSGVAEIARNIGSTIQLVAGLKPSCPEDDHIKKINIKDDDALKKAVADFMRFAESSPKYEKIDFFKICEAGRNNLSINPYGDVKPCISLQYILGNVRNNTIKNIWEKSKKLKKWRSYTKQKLKGCKGCQYMRFCDFCPGDALNYTKNMFKKYDTACRLAKIKYQLFKENME